MSMNTGIYEPFARALVIQACTLRAIESACARQRRRMQNVIKTIKQGEYNVNSTILASQEMMQRSSMGSPDVIMARRVMDVKSWRTASGRKNPRVQKEEDGIRRICTQARGLVTFYLIV